MDIVAARSTNLFIGSEASPRLVVQVVVRGTEPAADGPARLSVQGSGLRTPDAVTIGPLAPGEEARLEIGVVIDAGATAGDLLDAEVVVEEGAGDQRHAFQVTVVEPGWRMFMISHFHYDPVWWNTQAAYTETWGTAIQYRSEYQEPGLALVRAHLEMARRDPDYKFVLAELDYLKPYWAVYPEDRAYVHTLLAEGRLEFVGGTYNEPNTNLTSAESTIRNAIYGVGYQRDVLGGAPATAWQLDAFGHDPQFPGIMADAGITSSSWARGPFHEWGPNWVRGPGRMPFAEMAAGVVPRMQFPMEFDWIAPSGRALLTSFMADHYSAGWWMDAAPTLEAAEVEVHRLFTELAGLAATKNVLLPVGTDYTPPNKWVTAIHRDWNRRYVWPRFSTAIPREFFDAVREAQAETRRPFSPQTRDMNPIYTGKDVSFIDTKQAQRVAENTLMSGEKFATIASLVGARFPGEAIDKAWRQLLFGAHHDGITGSESDQVYLDLLGGWREAVELGTSVLDGALDHLGAAIDTSGDGQALTVFNAMSWPRSDIARVALEVPGGGPRGIELRDDAGASVPFVVESADRRDDGSAAGVTIAFLARDIPAFGYRTFRVVPSDASLDDAGWRTVDTLTIENEAHAVTVDPARGGAIASLVDKRTGKELVQSGAVANELRVYREYPSHPLFAEGPWHLTPDGRSTSATDFATNVVVETSPIGQRIRIDGPFEESRREQEIRVWAGIERVEMTTSLHDYHGHDRLFRVRFPAAVEGGASVSEVGNADDRTAVRTAQCRRRGRPVHPRPPGLQLVRPGGHGSDRDRRAGRHRLRPRPAHRRPSASPRSSRPTTRPLTMRCATWSSPSCARASPRPSRATTATAMASSTSTPTCPTSVCRSAARTRTRSAPTSWTPRTRATAPNSIASWPPRAGPACGSRPTATEVSRRSRSRTCAACGRCPCSSSPAATRAQRPRPSRRSAPTSTTRSSTSPSPPSSTARPARPRTTRSRS